MQQGMLFHALEGQPGVDLQQVIGECDEALDPAAFAQAWREVVARHPVLRTRLVDRDGHAPRQEVSPASAVSLPFVLIAAGPDASAERRRLDGYLREDRKTAFPLETPPLLRIALLVGRRSWFVATYHHLIIDARSMALMFREVLERHDAITAGRTLPLAAGRAYRDFITWCENRPTAGARAFWTDYLRGFSAPTPLPGGRPRERENVDDGSCGELMFRLPAAITERLRHVAREQGVTLNTLVQAAWAIVLSRYAGEEDVVFGALRAGRHAPVEGLETMLGLCINTVPVRTKITPELKLRDWLQRLRADWVAMRPHEHTPLSEVQGWSEVEPGRPLFATLLNVQDPAWDESLRALGGKWAGRRFDIRSRPHYPLAVDVYAGTGLTTKLFFEHEACTAAMAAQVLGHFRRVLEQWTEPLPERVGDLALLTPAESAQLTVAWNRTAATYPDQTCVHRQVEAHALAAPERLAVCDGRVTLTYGELNDWANRLAGELVRRGVRPGRPVAVCLERSAEMLVAWLAVLKAGGAFVPLDPQYPPERLAFQLQDCASPLVLVRNRETTAALGAVEPLAVADHRGDGRDRVSAPAVAVGPRDLAYIIYTSGSTGQPKGVQIEHRSLMNLVAWHQRAYALTAADRAPQLASPAFDASVWETWPYLAAGASLHIPDDETRVSPASLWRWFAAQRITVAFVPTPLAEALLQERWPADLALRALLTGGDRLRLRPPANFPCALINHYGPTESTVVTTCGRVDPDAHASSPTIGRPIANTSVFVLDPRLRLVPPTATGELFIAGDGLARGYWQRPELDAEKFVHLPLGAGGSLIRAYRTGDLVRWTLEGELEFVGRIDGQVKVRGCRIELGEIESVLQTHPAVHESIVVPRPDPAGHTQLVAYVRLAEHGLAAGAASDEAALLDHLRARLPAYMVPVAVVLVHAWPLTPNGKVDRRALPVPAPAAASETAWRPASATEELVARTWADVLRHDQRDGRANFFEIGGHSLLAAQVIARLNAQLPAPISVRLLFDHPTLAAFAREVDLRSHAVEPASRGAAQRLKRRSARSDLALAESQ